MAEFIAPIQRLIEEFRKIPGVGAKTAARYAFAVLNLSDEEAARFADAIIGVKRDVFTCPVCHGLSSHDGECDICSSFDREKSLLINLFASIVQWQVSLCFAMSKNSSVELNPLLNE